MSSDDVVGVVLIILSETVLRNLHIRILAMVIGGNHAVQILIIDDSTVATHTNGLDAAVNPTWPMEYG